MAFALEVSTSPPHNGEERRSSKEVVEGERDIVDRLGSNVAVEGVRRRSSKGSVVDAEIETPSVEMTDAGLLEPRVSSQRSCTTLSSLFAAPPSCSKSPGRGSTAANCSSNGSSASIDALTGEGELTRMVLPDTLSVVVVVE